jgi:hypothetical protein
LIWVAISLAYLSGEEGGNFLVQIIFICRRYVFEGGGGRHLMISINQYIHQYIGQPTWGIFSTPPRLLQLARAASVLTIFSRSDSSADTNKKILK